MSCEEYTDIIFRYISNYFWRYLTQHTPAQDTEYNRDNETEYDPLVCIQPTYKTNANTVVIKNVFNFELKRIMEESRVNVYNQFKDSLKQVNTWVDNSMIRYLSDIFDINMFFIQSGSQTKYNIPIEYYCNRKCIIFHYIKDVHFENIGVYNEDDKTITRLLDINDPIIQQLLK